MVNQVLLSIVIPSIPSRREKAWALFDKLESQVQNRLAHPQEVQILMTTDNKRMSIGKKREACVQSGVGLFTALLDDDDDVSDEYVFELHKAIKKITQSVDFINFIQSEPHAYKVPMELPSVICFKSQVTDKFGSYVVDMDLTHKENEAPGMNPEERIKEVKRTPWHVCAWRSDLAKSVPFPDVGYGEDWHWVKQLIDKATSQIKIDKVLHYYFDFPSNSEAPTTSNSVWTNPNKP